VTDSAALARAAEGAEGIVHAAAIAHLWTRDPCDHARVNRDGTRRVLEAAARVGARVVLVSSFVTLVGRETPVGATLDETSEIAPEATLGPYPRSKREAELAMFEAARGGLAACAVLPSAPVGPGDRRMTPPTRMIADLAAGRTPALVESTLNLVDVRALADGALAALARGAPGRRYLLAGEDLDMSEVAARVAAVTGGKPPRARVPMAVALAAARVEAGLARMTGRPPTAPLTGVRMAARRPRFDSCLARAELGFAPPSIDEALREAVAWLRAEGRIPPAHSAG
jgi:dihydroflavonol-4-reductase